MTNFLENKKNKIIIGIVLGMLLLTSTVLIITGKINLKSIMGNTAQGEYTCPEGYTLDGTNCIKTITYDATLNYGENYCPKGGVLTEDKQKCRRAATQEINVVCPKGGTYNKTMNSCDIANAQKEEKIEKPICDHGGVDKGSFGYCELDATPVYGCPSGAHQVSGSGSSLICGKTEYVCPNPNTQKPSTSSTCVYTTKKCPSGTTPISGGGCKKSTGIVVAPVNTTVTVNKVAKTVTVNKIVVGYECLYGNNSGNKCVYPRKTEIVTKKKCDVGNPVENGICRYEVSKEKIKYSYVCSSDWTREGTHGEYCTIKATPKKYYTCQNGGDLSGTTCTKTETVAATVKTTEIPKDIKVSSIKMDKNLEIELNNKKKITIVIEPNNAKNKNVICTSSNVEVAEINNLEINAKKVGKTSITCKAQDGSGVLSTVEVTVVNKTTTVTCKENQELKNGICVDKETNNNTNNTTNNNTNNNTNNATNDNTNDNTNNATNDNTNNNISDNTNNNTNNPTQNEESKCPSGYTLNGNICTKKETINAIVKYSCSNGYTLSGTQCKKSEIKEPTSTFTCPVGYSKSGNSCYRIDNKNATVSYTCSDDYTYNSTSKKCEKTSTIDVTTGGYTCPEGYDLIEGTRECIKVTEVKNTMSCPYTYLDGLCLKIDYQNASTINSCPNGYELKNEKCEGKTTMEAISNYKCSTGYTLNGKTCSKKIVKTVDTNRYCSTGYTLVNNKCQKTITVEANKNYSCQSGYTLSGTTCTRTLTAELK